MTVTTIQATPTPRSTQKQAAVTHKSTTTRAAPSVHPQQQIGSAGGRGAHLVAAERQPITMTDAVQLLTPGEVALMFRVDPKTVTRWAIGGRLRCIRTLGGHRRFLASEVTALLADETLPAAHRTD